MGDEELLAKKKMSMYSADRENGKSKVEWTLYEK